MKGTTAYRLWYGYCWPSLARFTLKIISKTCLKNPQFEQNGCIKFYLLKILTHWKEIKYSALREGKRASRGSASSTHPGFNFCMHKLSLWGGHLSPSIGFCTFSHPVMRRLWPMWALSSCTDFTSILNMSCGTLEASIWGFHTEFLKTREAWKCVAGSGLLQAAWEMVIHENEWSHSCDRHLGGTEEHKPWHWGDGSVSDVTAAQEWDLELDSPALM